MARGLEQMNRIAVEQKRTGMSRYKKNYRTWSDIHIFLAETGHLMCSNWSGLVH